MEAVHSLPSDLVLARHAPPAVAPSTGLVYCATWLGTLVWPPRGRCGRAGVAGAGGEAGKERAPVGTPPHRLGAAVTPSLNRPHRGFSVWRHVSRGRS